MSKVIYLVQGQSEYILNYFHLKERKDVDCIFITYDKEIDGVGYFPNSTWGEGRNYLLQKALESGKDYQYYIFLDDDVRFLEGSYGAFEKQLLKYKPAIAVPVFVPKTKITIMGFNSWFTNRFVPLRIHQQCRFADAQFIAFHRDVIEDRLVVPLQTHFDKVSWYATSSTQQLLMFNLYKKYILQFNTIKVQNASHRDYPKREFKEIQKNWLMEQFRKPYFDPRPYAKTTKNFFSISIMMNILAKSFKTGSMSYISYYFTTLVYTIMFKSKKRYSIPRKKLLKVLYKDSVLFKQYLSSFRNNE